MSLTNRLLLLIVVATLGLLGAALALYRVHQESDSAREANAREHGARVVAELGALLRAASPSARESVQRGPSVPAELEAAMKGLLAPFEDASVGYCRVDGTLVARSTIPRREVSPLPSASALPGPRGRGPRADLAADDLLPLDADFVSAECKAASADAIRQSRFFAPNDVLFVSVRGGPRALREWSLIRTPRRLRSSGSLAIVALVGVTLTVLVAAGVDTILKVRSGIHALADALVTAQSDLNAPIPRPATRELARIADGLRELMGHLWRAREHGVALERKIAHEARLASLGRVAAGVAHEIRNPLASMKLRLDALARRGLEPRSAKDVSRALDEVARLDRVVGSLLLVARKNVAATELVELRELVEARVAVVEDQARARGVVIERSGRLRTHADPIAFARVLDNLLRNAVEASPPGGTVTITIDAEQTGALLTVTDSGVGVPPEREGELFEPFFTSKPDGTGLGLSLSRAAVEAHGGTLSYRREGQRTSFEVRLPDRLAT